LKRGKRTKINGEENFYILPKKKGKKIPRSKRRKTRSASKERKNP